jgi:hypothetical protein
MERWENGVILGDGPDFESTLARITYFTKWPQQYIQGRNHSYRWRQVLLPAHGYAFMRGIQKWYGDGLLFQEIKSCKIAGVVIGWYDLSTSFYLCMFLVVHANEKQQLSLPSLVVEAHGQQLHSGRQLSGQRWTTWFVSKELIKP